jgi:hypothetical protein
MKFKKYLDDWNLPKAHTTSLKKLNVKKSGKWNGGFLYRVEDAKRGDAALGDGLYLSDDSEDVLVYGKNPTTFKAKPMKVLGWQSREHDMIRAWCMKSDEAFDKYIDVDSVAQQVRLEAEELGWDAIYGGGIYGIVVFTPNKFLKRVKK